jgi:hypothetical protein
VYAGIGLALLFAALNGISDDYTTMNEAKSRALARTAQAEGTLTDVQEATSKRGRTFHTGTVTFVTASGSEVRFPWKYCPNQVGMKVTVHYDPADPQNHSMWEATEVGLGEVILRHLPQLIFGLYALYLWNRSRRIAAAS